MKCSNDFGHKLGAIVTVSAALLLVIGGLLQPPAVATAQPSLTLTPATAAGVTIAVTMDGAAVPGAFVALTRDSDGASPYGAVCDENGRAVFDSVAGGRYMAVTSAPGARVGSTVVVVEGDSVTYTIALVASGSRFQSLGAYGAQTGTIIADGRSGVFYLNTTTIPSLFRTGDYGGSWTPVTLAEDDPDNGVNSMSTVDAIVSSGYPGEVAGFVGGSIAYSRDYGVTWHSITVPGTLNMGGRRQLLWGRVGTTSVLLLYTDETAAMGYALMPTGASAGTPVLQPLAATYKAAPGDVLHVAGGSERPVLAVAAADGSQVRLFALDDSPSGADSSLVVPGASVAGAATFVRLGGPATGPTLNGTQVPNTLLLYSSSGDGSAVMVSYAGAAWTATGSAVFKAQESDDDQPLGSFRDGPSSCAARDGAIGSVSPQGHAGSLAMCWVTQEGNDLVVRPVAGINNNTGLAFDAGYGQGTNRVLMSGDGSMGAVKSAYQDGALNRPIFPSWPTLAQPGIAADSGGVSVQGIEAAVVKDIALGPVDGQVATALGGGGRVLASGDGGDTWFTIDARSGGAIDWWPGADAGSSWILAGAGGDGDLLGRLLVTTAAPLAAGSVVQHLSGSSVQDLGLAVGAGWDAYGITAIAGVPSSGSAFVGTRGRGGGTWQGSLVSVDITGGVAAVDGTGFEAVTGPVNALAYCPADAHASVADTLFVAVGESADGAGDGAILVYADATGSPRTVAVTGDDGDFTDVRPVCSSGVVWAGRATVAPQPGESGLLRSDDGGRAFATVDLQTALGDAADQMRNVATLCASGSNVVVASRDYFMISSDDDGNTWAVLNDPRESAAKHFGAEQPGDVEMAAGRPAGLAALADDEPDFLLGSGAGLFAAVAGRGAGDTTVYVPLLMRH